jgi:hypothetical protein
MVLILAICLLLFAVFMMIQQEGFDAEICVKMIDKNTCINTAGCNWLEPEKKCYSCSELTSCDKCLTTDKCGWCKDSNKCVMTDRNGFPVGKACSNANYVGAASQCPSAQAKQPSFSPGPPTDMEAEVFNAKLPVLTYTQRNANSCSTETVVENVKKALDSSIEGTVRSELTRNNIVYVEKPKIEGFSQGLTLAVLGSITDDVRATTRTSLCANATDASLCRRRPACKWDGAKCKSK